MEKGKHRRSERARLSSFTVLWAVWVEQENPNQYGDLKSDVRFSEYFGNIGLDANQEIQLKDEIEQIERDILEQDAYIKGRKDEAAELESLISGYRQGLNHYKVESNRLQDERKSLWVRESELTAEIDKLKSEVAKAEKCLDHATPGVFAKIVICKNLDVATRVACDDGLDCITLEDCN